MFSISSSLTLEWDEWKGVGVKWWLESSNVWMGKVLAESRTEVAGLVGIGKQSVQVSLLSSPI